MDPLIYLDNNSTTPVDPAVLEGMLPYFSTHFANPSNQHHTQGAMAARAVERARQQVATAIGALPNQMLFTSGATESNNLAILGSLRGAKERGHIIASAIEHKSVLEPCGLLEREGWRVTYVPTDQYGTIDPSQVADAICSDTAFVSVMAANNEVGTLQRVAEIGYLCQESGIVFHCDAVQAVGRLPIDVDSWQVDLLSISAHKAYGPKGVGALYIRRTVKRSALEPLLFGGGQEESLRPGTMPVASVVGFGLACELAITRLANDVDRLNGLRDKLLQGLKAIFPDVVVHGHPTDHLPGLLSVGFPGLDGDAFLFALRNVAISQGSACTSGSPEPSYVLKALGISYELSRSSFRFGLGRFTTDQEINQALAEVRRAAGSIHDLSSAH